MAEDIKQLIAFQLKELEQPTKELTSWELEFLDSITRQFADRGSLSEKQRTTLERIYAEKTA